jgi:hypothetical protein
MEDATTYGHRQGRGDGVRGAEWAARLYWTAPIPFDPSKGTSGSSLAAFVNEGRWIVSCPECNGAQLAALSDPRFMCVNCGNAKNGGKWRPVVYPSGLAEIVAALDLRSDPVDQNWLPGETVAALLVENLAVCVAAPAEPLTDGVLK